MTIRKKQTVVRKHKQMFDILQYEMTECFMIQIQTIFHLGFTFLVWPSHYWLC